MMRTIITVPHTRPSNQPINSLILIRNLHVDSSINAYQKRITSNNYLLGAVR